MAVDPNGVASYAGITGSPAVSTALGNMFSQGSPVTAGTTAAANMGTGYMSQLAGIAGQVPQIGSMIQQMLGSTDVANSPGYQFALQQGLQSVNANAAANGFSNSGRQMLALQQEGQGLASQQYQTLLQDQMAGSQLMSANQNQAFNQLNAMFGNNLNLQGLLSSMQGQQFGQGLSLQQLLGGQQEQTFQNLLGGAQLAQQGNQYQQQNLLSLLGLLGQFSGATTGSPATAGYISSGIPALWGGAAGNLFGGRSSGSSGGGGGELGGIIGGVSDLLGGLF